MNQIIVLSNRLVSAVKVINKVKDIWLESRIKKYANSVRERYPNKLSIIEKSFAPLIVHNITGTVANLITIIRILLSVIIFLLLIIAYPFTDSHYILLLSLIIFIFAGALDLLDGPAARALNEVSQTGKMLDPLADKILLASALVIVGYLYLPATTYWLVVILECFLILIAIAKNFATHLPFTMASQANLAGKIKNVFELFAGGFLLMSPLNITLASVSNILFIISIPLALGSIAGYLLSIRRI